MHKIRILAVEDDVLHADVLRMHLDRMGYDLIDVVDNSAEVLRLLKATAPDLLLMDIDIGEEQTGIDLVKRINQFSDVPVIYLTSFSEKHIFEEARQTLPDAYILKPFDPSELQRAIELAFLRQQQTRKLSPVKARLNQNAATAEYVFVKDGDRLVKVCTKDILLIEAYDKYCLVYTQAKKYLLTSQLRMIVENLPPEQFLQIHRSYIINFDAVEQVCPGHGTIGIAGKQVPISKTYKPAFFQRMNVL